ncbi:MAG: LPS export ABC transporter periplasmic protein LptC [Sphingomonadales bacterium]|nr:LPS export ABC transporter periplasmic protein LptC [Sphingomonadales bacterium]MBD3774495.1 LPS export ABC transporter periplasmic protein LptC [Paracoccaceae bacterium]
MTLSRRIETEQAKELRNARRHAAAPGGTHDKIVHILARVLPMAVGVLAALMVITPLSPRGEVSFLLDRNKVAVVKDRLRVDNAMYRGEDDEGRPFSLSAGEAVQNSGKEGIVRMSDLVARLLLSDGPARLTAAKGTYDIDQQVFSVIGPLQVTAADGYAMTASDVSINLQTHKLAGEGGVEGSIPAGTFRADRIYADLDGRTVTLDGNARLSMVPGKLRMPQ